MVGAAGEGGPAAAWGFAGGGIGVGARVAGGAAPGFAIKVFGGDIGRGVGVGFDGAGVGAGGAFGGAGGGGTIFAGAGGNPAPAASAGPNRGNWAAWEGSSSEDAGGAARGGSFGMAKELSAESGCSGLEETAFLTAGGPAAGN